MLKPPLVFIIVSSEYMLEFIPFSPFSSNHLTDHPSPPTEPLLSKQPSSAISDTEMTETMGEQQTVSIEGEKRQSSLNHNLVKQLIITIKQMVGPSIRRISSGELNRTVQAIWHNFANHRHANKEILKALFDHRADAKLL